MGPYATAAELAAVLNITVTSTNTPALEACINAAAAEIDHHLAQDDFVEIDPGLLNRTNLNRAVEWWKAPSEYNSGVGVGIPETGTLIKPQSGFERHALVLLPHKVSWGLA